VSEYTFVECSACSKQVLGKDSVQVSVSVKCEYNQGMSKRTARKTMCRQCADLLMKELVG
jgi:hypothetical protein